MPSQQIVILVASGVNVVDSRYLTSAIYDRNDCTSTSANEFIHGADLPNAHLHII